MEASVGAIPAGEVVEEEEREDVTKSSAKSRVKTPSSKVCEGYLDHAPSESNVSCGPRSRSIEEGG